MAYVRNTCYTLYLHSIHETYFRIIDNLCEYVSTVSCIMELFGVYIKFLRCGSGNLSTFWMTYMDVIEILLGLIRTSREGDWMLHLASVRTMIPW